MRAYYATLTEGWYIVWFREHKYDLSFDFSRLCFAPFLSLQIPWVLIDSWHSCKSALAIHVAYFYPHLMHFYFVHDSDILIQNELFE